MSNKKFWLNDGPFRHQAAQDLPFVEHQTQCPWPGNFGGECPGVYYHRLQRDGWTLNEISRDGAGGRIAHFSRRVSDHWTLRKYSYQTVAHPVGRGCYFDEHALLNERSGEVISKREWEWAELDGGRIVWTESGALFAGRLEKNGITKIKTLYDFNKLVYERIQAPY